MSYEKDKDRYTRGVGAIAALDHRNHARYKQRLARARATNQLDKALAEYTYRPGGGIGRRTRINLSGLGALNIGTTTGKFGGRVGSSLNTSLQPDMPTHTGVNLGMPSPHGGFPTQPIVDTRPPKLYGGAGTTLQQPAVSAGYGYPLTSGGKPVIGVVPPAPMPGTKAPGAGLSTTVAGSSVVSGGGGGGGGGGGSTVQQPTFPGFETPQTPDIPEDIEPAKPGIDLKTVALVGAAGAALWWLLRKKKGTP